MAMPLDDRFYESVKPLLHPGMGTENVGPMLYSLIRMTRPKNILEVGMGYSTPFMASALHDNLSEIESDAAILKKSTQSRSDGEITRSEILNTTYYKNEYNPYIHAIDDFTLEDSSAPQVLDIIQDLGLDHLIKVHEGDFRGLSKTMEPSSLPLDLVWFDCGGPKEYQDFITEYWPLINPTYGLLLLHFTYWTLQENEDGSPALIGSGSIVNEFKRQQVMHGIYANFEVLSLVEPHKTRQGSVTMIRKLAPASLIRQSPYDREIEALLDEKTDPFPELQDFV